MLNQTNNKKISKPIQEEQIVLFKFKRAFHEESYDEIKIQSKKIKPNPQASQMAQINYRNKNFLDRQMMLADLFQKLQLNSKEAQQKQQNKNQSKTQQIQDIQYSGKSKSYFLKKINMNEIQKVQLQKQPNYDDHIRNHMENIRSNVRKSELQAKLNKFRKISQKSEQNKRIKYKIINIRQQNIVDFGGQKFEYEDLSKEYQNSYKITFDYYVLKRGQVLKTSKLPEIILPEEAQYLLQDQDKGQLEADTPQDSEEDSNRQDRSDYDYPQEDYHDDDQSEGVISGVNNSGEEHDSNDDDQNLNNSFGSEDEEQYYRQYLRRCKRQEQGDNQLTYLYNLIPNKHYEDSDQD